MIIERMPITLVYTILLCLILMCAYLIESNTVDEQSDLIIDKMNCIKENNTLIKIDECLAGFK